MNDEISIRLLTLTNREHPMPVSCIGQLQAKVVPSKEPFLLKNLSTACRTVWVNLFTFIPLRRHMPHIGIQILAVCRMFVP